LSSSPQKPNSGQKPKLGENDPYLEEIKDKFQRDLFMSLAKSGILNFPQSGLLQLALVASCWMLLQISSNVWHHHCI